MPSFCRRYPAAGRNGAVSPSSIPIHELCYPPVSWIVSVGYAGFWFINWLSCFMKIIVFGTGTGSALAAIVLVLSLVQFSSPCCSFHRPSSVSEQTGVLALQRWGHSQGSLMSVHGRLLGCCSKYVSSILYKYKHVVTFPNSSSHFPRVTVLTKYIACFLTLQAGKGIAWQVYLVTYPFFISLEEKTNFFVHAPLGQLLVPKQGHFFTGLGT